MSSKDFWNQQGQKDANNGKGARRDSEFKNYHDRNAYRTGYNRSK